MVTTGTNYRVSGKAPRVLRFTIEGRMVSIDFPGLGNMSAFGCFDVFRDVGLGQDSNVLLGKHKFGLQPEFD